MIRAEAALVAVPLPLRRVKHVALGETAHGATGDHLPGRTVSPRHSDSPVRQDQSRSRPKPRASPLMPTISPSSIWHKNYIWALRRHRTWSVSTALLPAANQACQPLRRCRRNHQPMAAACPAGRRWRAWTAKAVSVVRCRALSHRPPCRTAP